MHFKDYLDNHIIMMDGAMGTYYSFLEAEERAVSESANLSSPEKVEKIHRAYLDAGAKLIRTNTFAANTVTLNADAIRQTKIISEAVKIAKRAVGNQAYIAGDIGPIPEDAGTRAEAVLEEYKRICDVFIHEGIDIILFETFSDLNYIEDLAKYIKQKSNAFVMATFCLNKNGYTSAGISARRLFETIGAVREIDACGFNCGIGSGHMKHILKKLTFPENKYVFVLPNAGYPEQMQSRMVFMDNSYYFMENMREIIKLGVDGIGGCCGTTPEYIHRLKNNLSLEKTERRKADISVREKKAPVRKNDFYELFHTQKKVVAVELDPPFDADYEKLIEYAHALKSSGADLITMADSPMGRSRVDSILMSVKLAKEAEVNVMPHVCCRDKNMIAMRSGLLGAYINGIRNILIVTGDPVPSVSRVSTTGVFDYNSIQLMKFVKEMNEEHFAEEPLYYGAALNYGRGKPDKVIERMEQKIEAGAKYFLTQPVYSQDDIERIRYIKERVDTKILCGIMPFVSYTNANFIKNEIMGIHVPEELVERYRPDMTKEEAEAVGAEIASEIIEKLNPFADGYYFMLPFNRVSLMDKIKVEGR